MRRSPRFPCLAAAWLAASNTYSATEIHLREGFANLTVGVRLAWSLAGLALCLGPALAAEQGQLDASQSLFTVLAAINAAGYDAEIDSPANDPMRAAVRRELATKSIPCLAELKSFYMDHRKDDATAELSQYISFGLVVDGPPNFNFRLKHNELPPDVAAMEGFEQLLKRFYKEAGIDSLWAKAQPEFDKVIANYHRPLSEAVAQVNGYLRSPMSGQSGFRFQVYVDLLGAPNQIQTRSYGTDYFVVLTPSPEPQTMDVRHAYLHHMLDPLATRHAEAIMKHQAMEDYILGASVLDQAFKDDFLLLVGECVVRAVEARLATGVAQKQAAVQQALLEGLILTPHFAEQLALYESQQQAMRYYYPELIRTIDSGKEWARLKNVQFLPEKVVRKAKEVPVPPKPAPTAGEKMLQEAEDFYAAKDYDKARASYQKLLETNPAGSLKARCLYGLGRVAALQRNPELAEKYFQQTLEATPDAQTAAWAHVYLGRLSDAAGERGQATAHYQAVVSSGDASETARQAAESGLRSAFKKE
jgi:TolA-binding protein